jgi:phenylalanyl-tRNA synthetase beta chain
VRVPIGWLREYVELGESSDELAAKLAMLGFPVESIERRPRISGVVAGRLAKVDKHPNADRLQVCTVEAGADKTLTIATAATNVAQGQTVPVALIGAELVGLTIAPRKMRGIDSEGMLVSAAEIGLNAEWFEDGILQLEDGVAPGTDLIDAWGLNDDVLEVEVTANRVDVMSVLGVARELAAGYGRAVREPVTFAAVPTIDPHDGASGGLRVTLESADCRRYVAQPFSGPGPTTAPMWMRVRLALAGQRPIDDLVDVTNYVMFETGQPIHAFDRERLRGSRVIARDARDGEPLTTLDGVERSLDARILVIADESAAAGVAGVIGGSASEVRPATREIVVESANFNPARVRRAARALGVRTEASSRHERALSLAMPDIGSARASMLLQSLGWRPAEPFAVGQTYEPPAPVELSAETVTKLLGFSIDDAATARALSSLGFAVEARGAGILATPPPWRTDVAMTADAVEEVARIAGYGQVPSLVPPVFDHPISSGAYDRENAFAASAASLGYREAITFALQSEAVSRVYAQAGIQAPEAVEVLNPLSEDQRRLRFSLLPALLENAARYRPSDEVRIFEIGHVFKRGAEAPVETPMAALLYAGSREPSPDWRDEGFLTMKEEARALLRSLTGRAASARPATAYELHPGKTASLEVDSSGAGLIGAVNPKLSAAYGLKRAVYAALFELERIPPYRLPLYAQPSRFPAVERDLALVVETGVPAADIVAAIRSGGDGVLRDVRVFDEYRGPQIGEAKKSIAVRVVLQRDDATLTDAEAEAHVQRVLRELERAVGATLRA